MIGTILHSVDVFTILTFFITLLLAYIIWDNVVRVRTNIPGPTPWPIIGNMPSIIGTKNASETFLQMQKKYGDLVYLKLGILPIVLVYGYKNVHQVLVDNGNKTKFRPRHILEFLKTLFPGKTGLIHSNGQEWVDIRRFTMVALKDFGVGKQSIEEKIQDEVGLLMELFSKQGKKPTDCRKMFPKATSNIISSIIFGSRFDFDDPEFNNLLGNIATLFKYAAAFRLENCFPILDKVNPFNKTKLAVEGRREIQKYIATRIESVRCSFDANNIRHFLDVYLEQEEKPDSKISDESLFITIADLYIAGTDTTSVTLQWSMLYMIKYPDVQKKCRNQILEVIGEDRQPVVKDKDNIPYVMATLQEVQRISTIAPLSVPHVAIEDVEIDGKTIPRDTIIIPHLMSVHLDPTVWDKPEEFRPERFLDKDGHFVKKEGFSAFSMGPRLCPGKQLAESELLLFFVSIIQRFNLTKGDDNDQLPMTGIQTGTTNQPQPFKICFIPR
ncbi:cytochrome P450 2H1-like [Mytilus galloprovincialis]|uniref:cytochrome P450 2H1-like n=1 Tax=Mytilus galloprovincialis TaxID=29158 RepID=UPI003F7CC7A1